MGRLTARRPAIAWALALLFLFKGMVSLATVAFPLSPHEPRGLIAAMGCAGLAAGAAIWLAGRRIPTLGFQVLAGAGTLFSSSLVAHAHALSGMMVVAFSYPWTAIYAAHFFSRRAASAIALLISASFGVGLLLSGFPHVGIYWAIVTVTIWSICLLLGSLSDALRREGSTDHLTGLLNRSGFTAAALRERALADRTREPLTVAVIDLDDFKQVNDRAGHHAGDRLLVALAREWGERMRPNDILARHGGDEFVLLLPRTALPQAEAALARLRNTHSLVRWSIGISEWLPGEDLDTVLERADRLLYGAKLVKPAPWLVAAARE